MSINVEERVLKIPIPLSGTDGSSVEECSLELPKGYPAIGKIVYAEGIANPGKVGKELGRVILSGTVDIGLIYQTGQGEATSFKGVEFPEALEYSLPVELAEVTPETKVSTHVTVDNVTATVGKNEVINCDVVLAFEVEASRIQEANLLTEIRCLDQKVSVSKEAFQAVNYLTQVDLAKVVETTLSLAGSDPAIGDLLRVGVKPRIESSRSLAGKVIVEGELDFDLLYTAVQPPAPEPPQQIPTEENPEDEEEFLADFSDDTAPKVPKVAKKEIVGGAKFVLSSDVEGAQPEMTVSAKVVAVGLRAQVTAPDKVEVAIGLKGVAEVFEELNIDIVAGAEIEGEERVDLNRKMCSMTQTIATATKELVVTATPGISASKAELREVLFVETRPVVSQCKLGQDKLTINGKVHLDVLYLGENELGEETLDCLHLDKGFDFKETLELVGVEPGMLVKADADVATAAANVLDPFTLEANLLVTLTAEVQDVTEKELVTEAAMAIPTPKDGASLRVVIVQKGDSLWKLARKYGSTVEFIASYNKLEDINDLAVGQRLRIPSNQ